MTKQDYIRRHNRIVRAINHGKQVLTWMKINKADPNAIKFVEREILNWREELFVLKSSRSKLIEK